MCRVQKREISLFDASRVKVIYFMVSCRKKWMACIQSYRNPVYFSSSNAQKHTGKTDPIEVMRFLRQEKDSFRPR